ncbi:MAG: Mrp/NBP35 family ATP-binding protein [Candidatus Thalassarchaeaceae archaeon]|jgi:Mrp family chromosome partitioning ATPase|nr:Mrp/NBP35 family ATP-binding protein [Candidatus Thalassarchaeaceae archaeon]MDP7257347.1 Mrp/NBP35 family ATP-binding protein [Candidatus Thalassarchaeaceae archaeon]MDP7446701.1 Mrp/NBP35 family ATP-binding protein [Candidatus Thalassarchaeaceae archaeon]MDP7649579.1 Mrp/NBP35 family ATP-binding protein [Candidatus Thalassarchaeaceae archaeon]HJL55050.1 Mrp/NBP35 family ATP-binding protein [Candidatus Thalassarchaeaceae archaeon]|tara:strand:- start:5418 stop:6431 length:1014 start_codon:yes stop_codon:yes gene_type:complete
MADSPISHHSPDGIQQPPQTDPSNEQRAQMEQAYQQIQRKMRISKMDEGIKHKVMVLSGKGGVGKSTVATGLALSLARQGKKVGLMDIDITGPNVPKMLGLGDADLNVEDGQIFPAIGPHGLKVISMAFLLDGPDTPVIWRGPIKLGAIQQFIGDVAWGDLDALVIDFPPGTGDEPLTVSQSMPGIDGVVIVTTPQEVALLDSRKSINFAKTISLPILGVIENMRGYTIRGTAEPNTKVSVIGPSGVPLECNTDEGGNWTLTLDVFKSGGGEASSIDLEVPFLGSLPFDPGIVRGGDDGVHRIIADPEGETARAFDSIVARITEELEGGSDQSLRIT